MEASVPRAGQGYIQVTVKPALLSEHLQPPVVCVRHVHDGVLPHFDGYIGQLYWVPRPPSRK